MGEIIKVALGEDRVCGICSGLCESANREVNHWPEVAQLMSSRAQSRPALFPQHSSEGAADFCLCPLSNQSIPELPFLSLHMIYAEIKFKNLWFFSFKYPFSLLSFGLSTQFDSGEVPLPLFLTHPCG